MGRFYLIQVNFARFLAVQLPKRCCFPPKKRSNSYLPPVALQLLHRPPRAGRY